MIDESKLIYWNAYKFTILLVASLLCAERELMSSNWSIREIQQKLPTKLV